MLHGAAPVHACCGIVHRFHTGITGLAAAFTATDGVFEVSIAVCNGLLLRETQRAGQAVKVTVK